MATESRDGPTPNGGVKSTVFFYDSDGNEVDRDRATKATIVEYDSDGNAIHRTYGTLDPQKPPAS